MPRKKGDRNLRVEPGGMTFHKHYEILYEEVELSGDKRLVKIRDLNLTQARDQLFSFRRSNVRIMGVNRDGVPVLLCVCGYFGGAHDRRSGPSGGSWYQDMLEAERPCEKCPIDSDL